MFGRYVRLVILLVPLLALSACDALALQTTLRTREIDVIANPSRENEVRVLVRYEIPNWLRSSEIIYAQLRGRVISAVDGAMEVEVVPLATEWDKGNVTWVDPWTTPGGDFDTGFRRAFMVRDGGQAVRIDVTTLVRQWAHGERSNHGLMLKTARTSAGTFELARSRMGGSSEAVPLVKIWYLPQIE